MMIRRSNNLRFSRTPILLKVFIGLVALTALVAPANFVLLTPGPVTELFPKVLTVKPVDGVKSYPVNGQLYLLTIYVTNPETKVLGAEVLGCWVWGDCVAAPRSVFYEKNTSDAKERKSGEQDMVKSQNVALIAAKGAIARKFPGVNVKALKDEAIKVSLEDTGGPSGGLVFTLGLIDLLTPADILQGRKIAGTGTIAPDGTIGAIGGVTEKIIGAKKAGAQILFVSRENCGELPASANGISVVAINTIDQALDYLLTASPALNSAGIHGCASVGA
jgi:PDZ domain-containing protein